jgi:hypothetical protein
MISAIHIDVQVTTESVLSLEEPKCCWAVFVRKNEEYFFIKQNVLFYRKKTSVA